MRRSVIVSSASDATMCDGMPGRRRIRSIVGFPSGSTPEAALP